MRDSVTGVKNRDDKKSGGAAKSKVVRRTSIGGQAVIEGVMMKSATSLATAVRTEAGEITLETKRLKDPKNAMSFSAFPS